MKKSIDWAFHRSQQKKSGMTIRNYCRSHGLSTGSWYDALKKDEPQQSSFVPVHINSTPKSLSLSISFDVNEDGSLSFSGKIRHKELILTFLRGLL